MSDDSNDLKKGIFGEDAVLIFESELSSPLGSAHYSQLKYPDLPCRVSRLRIERGDWAYDLFD